MKIPPLLEDPYSLLETIVESSGNAVFSKTLEGLVLSWNSEAEQLYGYSASEMIGRSVSILVPEDRKPELVAILHQLAEGQQVAPFETVRRRKDGHLVDVSVTISLLQDTTGKIIGASTIARDITSRKQAEATLRASEAQKGAIFETALDVIIAMNHLGNIVEFNPAAEITFGYTRQEVIGLAMAELIIPASLRKRHRRGLAHYLATGEGPVMDRRIESVALRKDGSEFPIELAITSVSEVGDPFFIGTIRDITARKQAEERQRLLQEVSTALVSSLDHQITLRKIAHLLVPALADYCRIALVDEQQQIREIAAHHMHPEQLALVEDLYGHYKDWTTAPHGVQKLLQTGQPELISQVFESMGEVIQRLPELSAILKALDLKSYMGVPLIVHGKIIGAITFSSVHPHRFYTPDDVSFAQELAWRIAFVLENARLHREAKAEIAERKQAQEQQRILQEHLMALATTDPVTGLPNHRALIDRLDQELERAQHYDRSCSILFLDLDHFKALNDGYGHAIGDAVLGEFAKLVRSQLRGMDTVGRWSGEEFVVIVPELQVDEALALAEGVRVAVAGLVFPLAGGIHLTCSIGLASYPLHAQDRSGLLSAADRAMYAVKHFGRNQVRTAHDPAVLALFAASSSEAGREEAALVGMAEALVALVEARDHLTVSHCQQVADLVHHLALAMGWSAPEVQMLTLAARLHDLGKVAVPDTILQKPGGLTKEERALMQQHSAVGAEVVSHIPALRPLAPVIRAHHERWDGQGYPDQLAGETIPIGARILTVVDAYQAMITDRSYQPARTRAVALAELRRCAGSQFDPQVVDVLLSLLREPEEEVE